MIHPPDFGVAFEQLPSEPSARHEALVDLFGKYFAWVRKMTLDIMRRRVEIEEDRQPLGRIFRESYEEASKLSVDDRKRAYSLTERTLANFSKILLTMLSGQGFDDPLGPNHVFRFRLVMELVSTLTGEVVDEEVLNRDGKKSFPEYWGRWINQATDL